MADNATLPATGVIVTADEVTYSGDTTQTQIIQLAFVTGSEGARTLAKMTGDTSNGLDIDVTRLPALVAGSAIIGKVGIDQTTPGTTNAVETVQASMTYAHTTVTATTTTGALLASNSSRKYALFQNLGIVDVYIKINASAVASQGILLAAYGGSYEISPSNHNHSTAAVNGITGSSTASVIVTEGA